MELIISNEFGSHYRLDASSNLVNWVTLLTGTNFAGTPYFIDTNAIILSRRFYRTAILP